MFHTLIEIDQWLNEQKINLLSIDLFFFISPEIIQQEICHDNLKIFYMWIPKVH